MAKKFGTFSGVFVPSTEAILGTVLFLLMPLLTADVGLAVMLGIILLAHTVTLSTSFSLADCATNLNQIEGGGLYALTKMSLGTAFGGSIGIQLFLAQAASIGFYSIGFTEPLFPLIRPLLQFIPLFQGMSPEALLLQKQIIASVFCLIFFIIVMNGADFTIKLQMIILVILGISVATILLSPVMGITYDEKLLFSGSMNILGNRRITIPIFFFTFTQFFPAVTGISSGIGMSGDLKDPKKSIVKGTFAAILITLIVYILSAIVFSFIPATRILTSYEGQAPIGHLLTDLFGINRGFPANIPGILVITGVLFATSSSALSVFMTAPRTAQFLAKDNTLPRFLNFLQYDFKKEGTEPRYAVIVSFALGLGVIWLGNINMASMIVGIMFLAVYGWVNGAAFLERVSKNPGFRPTFRGHWTISLYGFLSCVVAIILFKWYVGIGVFILQFVLFSLILRYKSGGKMEGVWWGVLFTIVTNNLKRLKNIAQGAKNWRPVLQTLSSGTAESYSALADLSHRIASFQGMVFLNRIHPPRKEELDPDLKVHPFPVCEIQSTNPTLSMLTLLQSCHPGDLQTNTIMMDYNPQIDNVRIMKQILTSGKNLLILKNGTNYDSEISRGRSLDIWWRGERNGNMMVLLAYIINRSLSEDKILPYPIRLIRKLDRYEDKENARMGIEKLLRLARLSAEVIIIPYSELPFTETLKSTSQSAGLIMMGMPGNFAEQDSDDGLKKKIFNIDEFFFSKEIKNYDNLPPILFLKSSRVMNITQD